MHTRIELPFLIAVPFLLAMSACASGPIQQMTTTQGSVRAAEEVGAAKYPRAAYHLKLATDQVAQAEPLMDGDRADKRYADMLLVRAEMDAELALEMTKTAQQRAKTKTAQAKVRQLNEGGQ